MWPNVINMFCINLQAVTGDAILSRGSRSKKLLEQSLADIRTMVPTALAIQVCNQAMFVTFLFCFVENAESIVACRYLRFSRILSQQSCL